jgi:hypothetical protein
MITIHSPLEKRKKPTKNQNPLLGTFWAAF